MEERPETIEIGYKVRFPKGLMLFMSITSAVVGGGILGLAIYGFIIRILPNVLKSKDVSGDMLGFCLAIIFVAIFVFAMIYPIWRYKCVIDIYKKDRFIRMYGKKVKYEIEYKKIVSMKAGLFYTL